MYCGNKHLAPAFELVGACDVVELGDCRGIGPIPTTQGLEGVTAVHCHPHPTEP
jgi:hypothetical protein